MKKITLDDFLDLKFNTAMKRLFGICPIELLVILIYSKNCKK